MCNNNCMCSKICKSILAIAFCGTSFLFPAVNPASAADTYEFNPLVPIAVQIRQLRYECKVSQQPEECLKMEKRLKNSAKELRRICKYEPNDHRCALVKQPKKKKRERYDKCYANPHSRDCIRKKHRALRKLKKMDRLCKKDPAHRKCQPAPPKRVKKKLDLKVYCQNRARAPRCIKFKKYFAEKMEPEAAQSNTF